MGAGRGGYVTSVGAAVDGAVGVPAVVGGVGEYDYDDDEGWTPAGDDAHAADGSPRLRFEGGVWTESDPVVDGGRIVLGPEGSADWSPRMRSARRGGDAGPTESGDDDYAVDADAVAVGGALEGAGGVAVAHAGDDAVHDASIRSEHWGTDTQGVGGGDDFEGDGWAYT